MIPPAVPLRCDTASPPSLWSLSHVHENPWRSLFSTDAEHASMSDTHSPDFLYPHVAQTVHELPPNRNSHYAVYVRKVSCVYRCAGRATMGTVTVKVQAW